MPRAVTKALSTSLSVTAFALCSSCYQNTKTLGSCWSDRELQKGTKFEGLVIIESIPRAKSVIFPVNCERRGVVTDIRLPQVVVRNIDDLRNSGRAEVIFMSGQVQGRVTGTDAENRPVVTVTEVKDIKFVGRPVWLRYDP